jgi:chorismate synthase
MAEGVDAEITIQGRHDPCVVHRAVPVIEAAAALAICQLLEGV